MSLGAVQQGYRRRFYVKQAKETTYDAGGTLTHVFDVLPGAPMVRSDVNTETDAALANGSEFPTRTRYLERTAEAQFRSYASPEGIGLWGAYALGVDSVNDAGGTAKRHDIEMSATGVFPGSTCIEEHANGSVANTAVDTGLSGVFVTRFSFSWGQTGFSTIEVDMVGSGTLVTPTDQTESGLSKATLYFPNGKVGCWRRYASQQNVSPWNGAWEPPTTSGAHNAWTDWTSIGQQVVSGTFTYENVYGAQYRAGTSTAAGIYGVQPQLLKRNVTLELELLRDATSSDFIRNHQLGTDETNRDWAFAIEATSDVTAGGSMYSAAFIIPLAGQEKSADGSDGELATDTSRWLAKKSTLYNAAYIYTCDKNTDVYNQ